MGLVTTVFIACAMASAILSTICLYVDGMGMTGRHAKNQCVPVGFQGSLRHCVKICKDVHVNGEQ